MSDSDRLHREMDLEGALREELMRRPELEDFTVKSLLEELRRESGSVAAAAKDLLADREREKPPEPAEFAVPSEQLVREMINVPAEEWRDLTGRPEAEVLRQATKELREDLLATIAHFALDAARKQGAEEVALSRDGRFADEFVRHLMRNLPIDPRDAPRVLERLHSELLKPAREHLLKASWGHLTERSGDLLLALAVPAGKPSRAAALTV